MKKKRQGKTTSSATQADAIATITKQNHALIPITIDHSGKLRHATHEFLGMPDTRCPPTKPPWNKPADPSKTNEFAFEARALATHSPQDLMHGVNATWRELSTKACGDSLNMVPTNRKPEHISCHCTTHDKCEEQTNDQR